MIMCMSQSGQGIMEILSYKVLTKNGCTEVFAGLHNCFSAASSSFYGHLLFCNDNGAFVLTNQRICTSLAFSNIQLCFWTQKMMRLKIVQHGTGMIDFCYNDVCLGVREPPWPIFVTVTPHHRGFHPLEHQYNEGYI